MNSKAKGARGELEVAELLEQHGYTARRGQQFSGGADSQDVKHNVPGIHIEVKRDESRNVYAGLDQAIRDAGDSGNTPIVFRRWNRRGWVVVMRAEDFLKMQQRELW